MSNFETSKCVFVKGFIDPQGIQTISKYLEYAFSQELLERYNSEDVSSYSRYGDPLIETVMHNATEHMEELTGKKLYPTYSYTRVYVKGDVLKPHVDRFACEYSATIHVATKGESWPIWMKVNGGEPMHFVLEPGDAVVYKGCEVVHWREVADKTEVNAQITLHYVDQNGPYVDYKFDKRPGIGMSLKTRSK